LVYYLEYQLTRHLSEELTVSATMFPFEAEG